MQTHERAIIKQCIADLLDAGYSLSVYDGEETTVKRSRDAKTILAAMNTVDEEHLIVYRETGPSIGWVFFVYGNEPGVVINDYTTNLEDALKRTHALADRLSD